jgi:hypothetical protein
MNRKSLTYSAAIEIQGDSVLEYLGMDVESVKYRVLGFESRKVWVTDFRSQAKNAIQAYLDTGDLQAFHRFFNSIAKVVIERFPGAEITLSLYDNSDPQPEAVLWIAIGIENWLPNYDYHLTILEPIDDFHSALLCIYYPSKVSSWNSLPAHTEVGC